MPINFTRFAFCALAIGLSPALFAQDADHQWDKSYPISAKPSLTLETSDANLQIRSCGDCRSVHIHVDSGRKLSEYRIQENQSEDHVTFSLGSRARIGVHVTWGKENRAPQVTVETPSAVTLDVRSSDGNLSLHDLKGDLQIRSRDGSADISNVDGALRLNSGDGNVAIHNATGTVEARGSDGQLSIDGRLTALQIRMSDGNLEVSLADGSQLSAPSSIESSDGQTRLRLPANLSADLDATVHDGQIDCSLPLVVDHYDSKDGGSGHHVHGRLNAGGTALTIRSSDGSVSISQL